MSVNLCKYRRSSAFPAAQENSQQQQSNQIKIQSQSSTYFTITWRESIWFFISCICHAFLGAYATHDC